MVWPLVKVKTGLSYNDYTVAWICALPKELRAGRNMLDKLHAAPPAPDTNDQNIYTFGLMSGHNIVMACAGDIGNNGAAVLAARMHSAFHNLKFGLLVGIAGGVGVQLPNQENIFLGDVVVSKGYGNDGGVIVHDRGRSTQDGFQSQPYLNGVPEMLRNAFNTLESNYMDNDKKFPSYILEAAERNVSFRDSLRPNPTQVLDILFESRCKHVGLEGNGCFQCDRSLILRKRDEVVMEPAVHFGAIASGNQVIVDSTVRDKILEKHPQVLAVEMEGAGLMNIFGCANIRGICDYADSHKSYEWQKYAAAAAAAVAKEVLGIIPVSQAAAVSKPKPISTMIFPRNKMMIQRPDILQKLDSLLPCDGEPHRAALYGYGGSGKTQIALDYAYRRQEETSCSLFWVHAGTPAVFSRDYNKIAKKAGLPPDLKGDALLNAVCDWLGNQTNWLMVLDNADDVNIFKDLSDEQNTDSQSINHHLYQYIPQTSAGWLLWTSRRRDILTLLNENEGIKVPKMSDDESLKLLRHLDRPDDSSEASKDEVALLGPNGLDHLPLAIVGARAFMHRQQTSATQYLRLFNESEVKVLSQEHHDSYRLGVHNSVMKTWHISRKRIIDDHPSAERVIKIISLFDNQGIPFELIREAVVSENGRSQSIVFDYDIWKIIELLLDYSFLECQNSTQEETSPTYEQHRLLQLAMRNSMNLEQTLKFSKDLQEIICQMFPRPEFRNWDLCKRYLPHAVKASRSETPVHDEHFATLSLRLGQYHFQQGLYRQAEQFLSLALSERRNLLGEEHRETVLAMNELAGTWQYQGFYSKAEPLQLEVLELWKAELGERHPDTINAMNNLALTWQYQGSYSKAEPLQLEVLELRKAELGERHPDTIMAMSNLATTWQYQGSYSKAEPLQLKGLELWKAELGERHPDTIMAMHNLAATWQYQGSYIKAEPLQLEVLKLRKAELGERHPDTIMAMSNLAATWYCQGSYSQAQPLQVEVLSRYRAVLGDDHPLSIIAMKNLASSYDKLGRQDEAAVLRTEASSLGRE